MFYVFENGYVVYDKKYLPPNIDMSTCLEVAELPEIPHIDGKYGFISGCNLSTGEVYVSYNDIVPEPEPEVPPEPILPSLPPLSDEMQAQLNISLQLEYLTCLLEVNNV